MATAYLNSLFGKKMVYLEHLSHKQQEFRYREKQVKTKTQSGQAAGILLKAIAFTVYWDLSPLSSAPGVHVSTCTSTVTSLPSTCICTALICTSCSTAPFSPIPQFQAKYNQLRQWAAPVPKCAARSWFTQVLYPLRLSQECLSWSFQGYV